MSRSVVLISFGAVLMTSAAAERASAQTAPPGEPTPAPAASPEAPVPSAAPPEAPAAPPEAPAAPPEAPAAPPAPSAPAAAEAPAPVDDGMVLLHVRAPLRAEVERRTGATWAHVCVAPCDQRVPRDSELRITGPGLRESAPFRLRGVKNGRADIGVRPALTRSHDTGLVVAGAGGVLALAGVGTLAFGVHPSKTFSSDGLTHNGNENVIAIGTTLLLAGVAAGITGGALVLDNRATGVSGDAVGTEPVERERSRRQTEPSAARYVFPLLSGVF